MKRRIVITLLLLPLLLVGLAWLAFGWLMGTSAGSTWALAQAMNSLEGRLSVAETSGDLRSGLVLEGLRFESDGAIITAPRADLSLDVGLLPLSVTVNSMGADGVTVQRLESEGGGESSIAEILPGLRLPVAVEIERAELKNLVVLGPGGDTELELQHISLSGNWQNGLENIDLALAGDVFEAQVTGRLDFTPGLRHQLQISARLANLDLGADWPEEFLMEMALAGDESKTRVNASGGPPELQLHGDISDPFSAPAIDAEFTVGDWLVPGSGAPGLRITALEGRLQGLPEDYGLKIQGVLEEPDFGPVEFNASGRGDLAGFRFEDLHADAGFAALGGSGALDWSPGFSLDLALVLERFSPGRWLEQWPDQHPLSGSLDIALRERSVVLTDIQLQAQGTAFTLSGDGRYDLDAGIVDGELGWQALSWLPGDKPPVFSSGEGRMKISGSPQDWRMQGGLLFQTPQYPGGEFAFAATGNLDSAVLDIERGEALGGSLAGQTRLDWAGAFRWQADLALQGIDLGALSDDWPARLDGELGIMHDTETERLALDLRGVEGEIEGHLLTAAGGLVIDTEGLGFKQLTLFSGESRVALDGHLQEPGGIEFSVDIRRPGWLADTVGGNLAGTGHYAPRAANPFRDLRLDASQLVWGDLQVDSLSLHEAGGAATDFDIQAIAEGLVLGDTQLDQLRVDLEGNLQRQAVKLAVSSGEIEAHMALEGAVADWENLLAGGWGGQLNSLDAAMAGETWVNLREPAPTKFTSSNFMLQQACLDVLGGGVVCMDASYAERKGLDLAVDMNALPLGFTHLFLDHDLEFTQLLDGGFSWQQAPGQKPSGRAGIDISAGRFGEADDEDTKVRTASGFIGFELQNGNLTTGRLDIPFPGLGVVDVDFEIAGLALDGSGQIRAQAMINFEDLGFIEAFSASLDDVHGRMNSRLSITGATSDPVVDGHLTITEGRFLFPYLGTQVTDLELRGHVDKSDTANAQSSLTVGKGEAELSLQADFREWLNPQLEFRLSGSGLGVAELPDLDVDIDTDIELAWQAGVWQIGGFVEVPHAHITPITWLVAKTSESEDLRVVAGELPVSPASSAADDLALTGELAIRLGEDVRLETDNASLKFGGGLDLAWDNVLMPVGDGAVSVVGEITAWGPRLHLVNSFVRFPLVPINNPVLDFRAERDVFGNSVVRNAGIRVGGTVRRPEVEAYTIPLTTRDRAWAVLITGSDVNFGQGVGALDVGTYIAPRIFLSYGVSLFDSENIIGIRYDLRKGWGVKATSSQRESGFDISYTIVH